MIATRTLRFCLPLAAAALTIPSASQAATLLHRWSFDTLNDSVGTANVTLNGTASLSGGQLELPGGGRLVGYGSIPGITSTLASNQSITVEAWFTLDALTNWSKVWMFGTPGASPTPLAYIGFTPRAGVGANAPKIDFDTTAGGEINTLGGTDPAAMLSATQYYVATVFDAGNNTMSFYINGVLADSAAMGGGNVTQIGNTAQNFLGAAVNFGDPDMDGRINEMRIWNNPLSPAEIALNNTLGPNVVPEPGVGLLGLLGGLALIRRRRA